MANQVVSLNTAVSPYEADLAQIGQRQKLADMLQQQALQPPERFSYNGIEAHTPSTAYLAKMLQGVTAVYGQKKTIDDQRALSAKAQSDASDWITKLTSGVPATPEVPGSVPATPADVNDREQGMAMGTGAQPMTPGQAIPVPGGMGEGANVGSPPVPGHAPTDPERLALLMQGSANPVTSSFAGPMLMQEMSRQRLLAALGVGSPQAGSPAGAAPAGAMPGGAPAAPGATPGAPGAVPGAGMPMPNGAPSPGASMPGATPQMSPTGGPAGGIPMAVWLATDPTGKAYMEQLAKDYEAANKPVVNRGYGLGRVVDGKYVPDPASIGQIRDAETVKKDVAQPYQTGMTDVPVLLPGGDQTTVKLNPMQALAYNRTGQLPPEIAASLGIKSGQTPSATSPAAPQPAATPAVAPPGIVPGGTNTAPVVGRTQTQNQQVTQERQVSAGKALDDQFAKDNVAFTTGGAQDTARQLAQLQDTLTALKTPGANLTGPITGNTPDIVNNVINPKAVAMRERVEEVVQRSLRSILGAQFTENEGKRLIARAYNPQQPEAENAVRVQRLMTQIQQAYANKLSASDYFAKNNTLQGWNGKLPSMGDFDPDPDRATSTAQGSVVEGATATNPQTGAKIIFKGGQWQPAQ